MFFLEQPGRVDVNVNFFFDDELRGSFVEDVIGVESDIGDDVVGEDVFENRLREGEGTVKER